MAEANGPHFELTLHLAGSQHIYLEIEEAALTTNPHPSIAAAAAEGTREGFRTAALTWAEFGLDPQKQPGAAKREPALRIIDRDLHAWHVPRAHIMCTEFVEPMLKPGSRVGFSLPGQD